MTDGGFLVSLPRLPAPHAMETAVPGLPVWEGWRVAGVHLLSKLNPFVVVIIITRAFLSSFSELLVPFLQGNPFVSFLSHWMAFDRVGLSNVKNATTAPVGSCSSPCKNPEPPASPTCDLQRGMVCRDGVVTLLQKLGGNQKQQIAILAQPQPKLFILPPFLQLTKPPRETSSMSSKSPF